MTIIRIKSNKQNIISEFLAKKLKLDNFSYRFSFT